MAETHYPYGPGSYDTEQLAAEIGAAGVTPPLYLNGSGYTSIGSPATSVDVVYQAALTPAEKTVLDAVVAAHKPGGPRKPRTLPAIYADLVALTAAQQGKIWADLSAGTPAKYLTDPGPEPGAISTLDLLLNKGAALGAAFITDVKLRIASIYVRDNPKYLVRPAFDNTISVDGSMPA